MFINYGQTLHKPGVVYVTVQGDQGSNQFSTTLFAFLQPLDTFTWLGFRLLFVLLGVTLTTSTKQSFTNVHFWLVSALLEQGTDGNMFRNKIYTGNLALIWIMSCIFVRNIYTSTLYGDITNSENTLPLPKSLEKLVVNGQYSNLYKLLITSWATDHIEHLYLSTKIPNLKNKLLPYTSPKIRPLHRIYVKYVRSLKRPKKSTFLFHMCTPNTEFML